MESKHKEDKTSSTSSSSENMDRKRDFLSFNDDENETEQSSYRNKVIEDEDDEETASTMSMRGGVVAPVKEISAPYEVPHYPIEIEESRKNVQMHFSEIVLKELEEKAHYVEATGNCLPSQLNVETPVHEDVSCTDFEDHDFVPHFQRVYISGEDNSGVPFEDLQQASKLLRKALRLRDKYMKISKQSFSSIIKRFLYPNIPQENEHPIPTEFIDYDEDPPSIKEPWNVPVPPDCGYHLKMEDGIIQVYKPTATGSEKLIKADYPFISFANFIEDMRLMCSMITDGPLKSFCFRRLSYLTNKFQLHLLLNEIRELAAQVSYSLYCKLSSEKNASLISKRKQWRIETSITPEKLTLTFMQLHA